jgi:hypothetical protein
LSKGKFFYQFLQEEKMKSRIYHLLLAAVTAAFVTACDNTDTTGDTTGTGAAGGVGTTEMDAPAGAEGTTSEDYPASEIPSNVDPQNQDSDMTNTDPNTTNTNP